MYSYDESSLDTASYTESESNDQQELWETESGLDHPNPNYSGPRAKAPRVPRVPRVPRKPVKVIDENMDYALALQLQRKEQQKARETVVSRMYPTFANYYRNEHTYHHHQSRFDKMLENKNTPLIFFCSAIVFLLIGIFAIKGAVEDIRPSDEIKLYCDYSCASQNNTIIVGRQECRDILNSRIISICKRYDIPCCGNDYCVCRTNLVCDAECKWKNFGYHVILVFGIICLIGVMCCLMICYSASKNNYYNSYC